MEMAAELGTEDLVLAFARCVIEGRPIDDASIRLLRREKAKVFRAISRETNDLDADETDGFLETAERYFASRTRDRTADQQRRFEALRERLGSGPADDRHPGKVKGGQLSLWLAPDEVATFEALLSATKSSRMQVGRMLILSALRELLGGEISEEAVERLFEEEG